MTTRCHHFFFKISKSDTLDFQFYFQRHRLTKACICIFGVTRGTSCENGGRWSRQCELRGTQCECGPRSERGETHNNNKNKKNTQRPDYLGTQARVQNQRLCHWGRSIGGDLRSVFGASSSSGRGGSGGLQGREKHNTQSLRLPPAAPRTSSLPLA